MVGRLVFTLSYRHSGEQRCLLTKVAAALREAWKILFAERESKSVCVDSVTMLEGKDAEEGEREPAALWSLNLHFPLTTSSAGSCFRHRAFTQEAMETEPLGATTCGRGLGHGARPVLKVPHPSRDFRRDYRRMLSIPFASAVYGFTG